MVKILFSIYAFALLCETKITNISVSMCTCVINTVLLSITKKRFFTGITVIKTALMISLYCMSEKTCPLLYIDYTLKMG